MADAWLPTVSAHLGVCTVPVQCVGDAGNHGGLGQMKRSDSFYAPRNVDTHASPEFIAICSMGHEWHTGLRPVALGWPRNCKALVMA